MRALDLHHVQISFGAHTAGERARANRKKNREDRERHCVLLRDNDRYFARHEGSQAYPFVLSVEVRCREVKALESVRFCGQAAALLNYFNLFMLGFREEFDEGI
jgi:hypothetical protein